MYNQLNIIDAKVKLALALITMNDLPEASRILESIVSFIDAEYDAVALAYSQETGVPYELLKASGAVNDNIQTHHLPDKQS